MAEDRQTAIREKVAAARLSIERLGPEAIAQIVDAARELEEAKGILADREVSSPLFAIRSTAREAQGYTKVWWSGDGDDAPGEWVEEEIAAWRNAPRGDLPEFGQWVARIEVFVGKYAYCPVESFDGEYL